MARMPSAKHPTFLRDFLPEWEAVVNGFTFKTNTDRQKYWLHWEDYASTTKINPFLNKSVPPIERDIICRSICCSGQDREVRKRKPDQGVRILGCPCGHLKYHWDGWKIQLALPVWRQIITPPRTRSKRFPTGRPVKNTTTHSDCYGPHNGLCETHTFTGPNHEKDRMPSISGFLFLTSGQRIYKTTFCRLGWEKGTCYRYKTIFDWKHWPVKEWHGITTLVPSRWPTDGWPSRHENIQ